MKFVIAVCSLLVFSSLFVLGFHLGWDMSWQSVAAKLGVVVASAAIVGSIYKKIFLPVAAQVKGLSDMFQDVNGIVQMHRDIDFCELVDNVRVILEDLKPNSGTSLRDAVDRIESRLIQMEGVQCALRQDEPIAIFRCDVGGRNAEVNRTYCRWLKVTEEELLGYGWKNFVEDPKNQYEILWKKAFVEGREVEMRLTLMDRMGSRFWADLHAYPILGKGGEVLEYLGIMHKAGVDGCCRS